MRIALINGKIITPYRILENSMILLDDGIILGIKNGSTVPEGYKIFDCQGFYVSPGFIDMHLHGGGGYDFMDGSAEAILGAAKEHIKNGTTSLVPTTLTCPDEELFEFFECFKDAKKDSTYGLSLLGIHLEGPYFSLKQCGAQDPTYIKKPNRKHFDKILNASSDIIRVSAAPELEGSLELGQELTKRGILAAIGHSDACYQELVPAYECGFTHVTHLYSGMSSIHRRNAYRYLGVVETSYLIDGMTVEIIADGCHLPKELLELIVKTKSNDKISLITDSSRGAGMPEGSEILLGSLKHGQKCYIEDGVAIMPDHSCFGGSVCTSNRCVRTMHKLVGLPINIAVSMMTINPAKVLHLETKKGMLAPGYDADIVVFDEDINVKHSFIGGKQLF